MLEAKILYRSSDDNVKDSSSGGRKFSSISYISNPSNKIRQDSGIVGQSTCNAGYSEVDNDSNSNTLNLNTVASRPKKRKDSTFSQSPWHKIYMQGSELCHSMSYSISEQEWALATHTLSEKVDTNEAMTPSKRRLLLSTNLMQQLFKPAPAFVFSGNNAAYNYETVLYFVSRIALANACSLQCLSDFSKSTNRQIVKTASDQDQHYSSLIKDFMEKKQKLESDLQCLERTTSILDISLEIQDLEKFSVINHLAKFHFPATTFTRSLPQRYAVEIQMPRNLPEPVLDCLSL
ncbi:unnamed protein product [Microthlaspi erraticum]|uniref:Uncharacterized protein n=1 Tax=Microthlaspi erraticum TaxID=1685480 RepID=A0A6D2KIY3_9BRAS|nr:unnamed protein product [Microthlaspi erraticum]